MAFSKIGVRVKSQALFAGRQLVAPLVSANGVSFKSKVLVYAFNRALTASISVTVKAIAKAVEGMDNESYNKGQDLEPVINRLTRIAVGEPSKVMSIARVTGIEGSEVNYKPE